MCLYVFLFVEPGSKNGKSAGSYANLYLFRAGFFTFIFLLFADHAEFKSCLNHQLYLF